MISIKIILLYLRCTWTVLFLFDLFCKSQQSLIIILVASGMLFICRLARFFFVFNSSYSSGMMLGAFNMDCILLSVFLSLLLANLPSASGSLSIVNNIPLLSTSSYNNFRYSDRCLFSLSTVLNIGISSLRLTWFDPRLNSECGPCNCTLLSINGAFIRSIDISEGPEVVIIFNCV